MELKEKNKLIYIAAFMICICGIAINKYQLDEINNLLSINTLLSLLLFIYPNFMLNLLSDKIKEIRQHIFYVSFSIMCLNSVFLLIKEFDILFIILLIEIICVTLFVAYKLLIKKK